MSQPEIAWRRPKLILSCAALAAAVAASGAPARALEGDVEHIFHETIDVRVVNVEVAVTDRRGDRVIGLGPGDFRLIVDGAVVPIAYFTEVRDGVAVAPVNGEGEGAVPGVPGATGGEPMGTSYLVFIDDLFPIKRDRNRVLSAFADQLDHLGPGDRMAVVVFDGTRVEMLTSWTDSTQDLREALAAVEARPARGLQRIATLQGLSEGFYGDWVSRAPIGLEKAAQPAADLEGLQGLGASTSVERVRGGGFRTSELDMENRYRTRGLESYVERAMLAAVATMRGVASPPGRKVMLLFSGGWPMYPASCAIAEKDPGRAAMIVPDEVGLFEPLIDAANLLGYTLYPVDVPGAISSFGADVERTWPFPLLPTVLQGSPFARDRALEESLYYLAERTGGRAMTDALRLDSLREVVADTRSYYWLGFTPPRTGGDQPRRIQVMVLRPDVEIRTRHRFRVLSRAAEADLLVESALFFDPAPSSGTLAVETGPPVPLGRRLMEVPITVSFPVDAVATVPHGGGRVAWLELRLAAVDDKNRRTEVAAMPFELEVDESPATGASAAYTTRVMLRRAAQELVVSVYDVVEDRHLLARVAIAP